MGSTGAPWNIPYVEPTDNPRVYPAADEGQALAIAAGLTAVPGVKQLVVATSTTPFTTTSSTYVNVTNFTATITPTSNTSKIVLLATHSCKEVNDDGSEWELRFHDGTGAVGLQWYQEIHSAQLDRRNSVTGMSVDAPDSTSAITYTVQAKGNVNPGRGLTVNDMTLILMEVAP